MIISQFRAYVCSPACVLTGTAYEHFRLPAEVSISHSGRYIDGVCNTDRPVIANLVLELVDIFLISTYNCSQQVEQPMSCR